MNRTLIFILFLFITVIYCIHTVRIADARAEGFSVGYRRGYIQGYERSLEEEDSEDDFEETEPNNLNKL